MPKYIREGRFGPPKSFKTGAVVSTYPRPLLVFEFDPDGTSVIQEKMVEIKPEEFDAWCKKKTEELPPLAYVDFHRLNMESFKRGNKVLGVEYVPTPDETTFPAVAKACNSLLFTGCPWKTFVFDTVTGFSSAIYGHQSATKAAVLADARKWAGNIGMKVKDYVSALLTLPCHVVVIMHSQVDQNELNKEIRELPMIYSTVREMIGALFSQYFYAFKEGTTPKLRNGDAGLIRGVGTRWPRLSGETVGPLFNDIYKGVNFNE